MTKTNTPYTPGPWSFDGISPKEAMFIVAPDRSGRSNDIYIAEIALEDEEGRLAPTQAERNANARLIAAATELLEALDGLLQAIWAADLPFDVFEDGNLSTAYSIGQMAMNEALGDASPDAEEASKARGQS